jgi:hypothetical protein
MPAGNRVTIPQEFYDKTSDMLLVQPEPQYLYAQLFLGALGISLAPPEALGLAGRQVGGQGADYIPVERDRLMLSNPMFTHLIAGKVDFSAAPGNSIRINRPAYSNTTYTEVSRRIASSTTISTTPVAAQSEQTNLTLFRYGGPYDQANLRVAPIAIEAFDSNMGVHNMARIHGVTIVRDCHRFIDAVNVQLLDKASITVYPEGMTADNDATAKGSFPFTLEQLLRAERKADDANAPTFPDGFRAAVMTPTQVAQLGLDPLYARSAAYMPEYNNLFPQYVKSVSKSHIFKSTTLTTASNSSSVNVHYGHYVAPGALLAGMGRPLRVMPSTDDNYGETAKVVWIGDLAFGLADNRLVLSMRSSEDAQ